MKVIIASDIHGSYEYTKKLENLIIKENPNKIILLGDILYHGARNALPNEYSTIDVTNTLNKYSDKIIAVRGNCDSEVDNMVLDFNLTADFAEITLDGIKFYLSHGHLNDKYKDIFNNHYLLNGHSHIYNLDGKILNPGSVGIPKVNKEHTCFIYENGKIKLINLEDLSLIKEVTLNEK